MIKAAVTGFLPVWFLAGFCPPSFYRYVAEEEDFAHEELPVGLWGSLKEKSARGCTDDSIKWRNEEGKYHREDVPAREWPGQGAKAWFRNGKLYRDDGPAMEGPLGES